jgi:hypothetical protein
VLKKRKEYHLEPDPDEIITSPGSLKVTDPSGSGTLQSFVKKILSVLGTILFQNSKQLPTIDVTSFLFFFGRGI